MENLLLDNDGYLKITDFGHAGIFSRGWDVFSTGMLGSLFHISPEQIEGKCYHGEKIDIWALGVLLYRLVVGRPPFFSSEPDEFIKSVQQVRYEIPSNISPELSNLLQKILRVDPEKRLSIEQILQEPWCKGTKLLPTLQMERVYLDSSVDAAACWQALKDVTASFSIHVMEHPPPPNESRALSKLLHSFQLTHLEMMRSFYPKKEVKFTVLYMIEDDRKILQFNLKQGEGFDFHKMVSKIKVQLAAANVKLEKSPQLLCSEPEDLGTTDSEDGKCGASPRPKNFQSQDRPSTCFDPAETVEPPPSLPQDRAIGTI